MSTELTFKPRILGMICNWCTYGGADLAGVSRFQYPPYIRLIRVMCSGRVELEHILRAFSNGQDGVFIGGCHLNDCHYNTEGNYDAISMVLLGKKILEYIGVNPERLRLEWVSAGEGIRFANIMNEFSMKVENLGPLGKSEGIDKNDLRSKLEAVTNLVPYIKLVDMERLRVRFKTDEEYYKFFRSEEFGRLFDETVGEKLAISQIITLLREGSHTSEEIAKVLGLTTSEVSRHLNSSSRQGFVRYEENQKCYVLA
ncbi:hydrogenase iron-sulfur subunit [Desulfosporosinus sp. BICA1-9]|uniref:hydrogenase iron-sulfur subunit n=1 Tax=Desulfosporosinus sp. BICA1-9 TaxID=1531958 RepID=UPI00054B363A|nr:hydrogenase iron-sulfur subunit [Desulfosporosinus sp. BICA1-9]KJS47389.1 MAG: methyl-viologen-reducing hydrogenase subunit delta [Peptococcaceae bacterium BRH_c23]KJS87968.1 MAG: methyl-viologen-reducing hydrogenase subunit delta [Desulfosporosinus sp. BICA1-9]HBW39092.1 hydrogenase iron-sulfur subunit [Desulfosporosinus sp.]